MLLTVKLINNLKTHKTISTTATTKRQCNFGDYDFFWKSEFQQTSNGTEIDSQFMWDKRLTLPSIMQNVI